MIESSGSYLSFLAGSTLPQFTPTRIAQSLSAATLGEVADLLLPGLLALVVIQMPRVVADLVDVRRDEFRQAVVLLQVDRQIGRRLPANLGQRLGVLLAVDGNPHDVGPGRVQVVDLRDGGVDVWRVRRRHALHGDRMAGADGDRTDAHATRGIAARMFKGIPQ